MTTLARTLVLSALLAFLLLASFVAGEARGSADRPTCTPALLDVTDDTAAWLDYRADGTWVDERSGTVVGVSPTEDTPPVTCL